MALRREDPRSRGAQADTGNESDLRTLTPIPWQTGESGAAQDSGSFGSHNMYEERPSHSHLGQIGVGSRNQGDEAQLAARNWAGGERSRGPKGYQRSDARIREDVCERLMQEDRIDSSEVTVDVYDAVVVLHGSVPERRMKHAIEDVAARCAGVVDVDNRIRVSAPSQT